MTNAKANSCRLNQSKRELKTTVQYSLFCASIYFRGTKEQKLFAYFGKKTRITFQANCYIFNGHISNVFIQTIYKLKTSLNVQSVVAENELVQKRRKIEEFVKHKS